MYFLSTEIAWNSVDARGDDGMLHNGRVVDVMEGGLVVHFGGTGLSGPKLIPFGNVYCRLPRFYSYMKEVWIEMDKGLEPLDKERPVEVLLRLEPEDPWKWYPAMLLHIFGIVRVTLPDREQSRIVPEHRIRARFTEEDLAAALVVKGSFAKIHVTIPSEHAASLASDDQLIKAFSAHCRHYRCWMIAAQVFCNPEHELLRELTILERRDNPGQCKSLQPLGREILSALRSAVGISHSSRFPSPAVLGPQGDIRTLYRDPTIIPQIFQCLATVQQSKLRAECKRWDAFLMSPSIRRVVVIARPISGLDHMSHVYRFAACLYNCLTQHTTTMVLYGAGLSHHYAGRLDSVAHLLQCIMKEKGLPPAKTLLLGNQHLDFRVDGSSWVNGLCRSFQSLAGVCQQVVSKNVRVVLQLVEAVRHEYKFLALHFCNQQLTRQLNADNFWTVLNNGLRDLILEQTERLADGILSSCAATTRSRSMIQVTNIIALHCKIQFCSASMIYWGLGCVTKLLEQSRCIFNQSQILNITKTLDPHGGVRYGGMTFSPYGDRGLESVDVYYKIHLTGAALPFKEL